MAFLGTEWRRSSSLDSTRTDADPRPCHELAGGWRGVAAGYLAYPYPPLRSDLACRLGSWTRTHHRH